MEPRGVCKGGSERLEPGLVENARGAVSTEYVVLLAMAGMVVAAAVVGLGAPLVASFSFARAVIVSPTP